MSEQTPVNEPEPFDRRAARRERREEGLADPSRGGAWVAGFILIILGAVFLMRNTGIFNFPLRNWWALFILIPAVGALDTALRVYRRAGNQLNRVARSSLLVGLVLVFVTVMFLFEISWAFFGPLLLILVGIALIVNYTIN
jgi:hypothetical protein